MNGAIRGVIRVRRGPVVQKANGTTGPEWAALDLTCGHSVVRSKAGAAIPKRAQCPQCPKYMDAKGPG